MCYVSPLAINTSRLHTDHTEFWPPQTTKWAYYRRHSRRLCSVTGVILSPSIPCHKATRTCFFLGSFAASSRNFTLSCLGRITWRTPDSCPHFDIDFEHPPFASRDRGPLLCRCSTKSVNMSLPSQKNESRWIEGDRSSGEDVGHEPKSGGKVKRNCAKWWWAYLLALILIVVVVVIPM